MTITRKPIFQPTPEQAAIFAELRRGTGHVMVEALAGTGKTTTEVEGFKYLSRGSHGAFAFNRVIGEELQRRLPKHVWAGTFHRRGYWLCAKFTNYRGKLKMEGRKYYGLARQLGLSRPEVETTVRMFQLLQQVRPRFFDCDQTQREAQQMEVAQMFGISPVSDQNLVSLCREGIREWKQEGMFTFNDMIWIPLQEHLLEQVGRFDVLMIDEYQDLNRSQQEFALLSGARLVVVGDKYQGIYGFRGADLAAFETFKKLLQPTILPLTVSQRCPWKIVRLAQKLVPAFTARPTAEDGDIYLQAGSGKAELGDLVLCRTNAPLVRELFGYWRLGVPAKVLGRDLEKVVLDLIREIGQDLEVGTFLREVERHKHQRRDELQKLGASRGAIELMEDNHELVYQLVVETESVERTLGMLQEIFADEEGERDERRPRDKVRLSTVHRAKGLEAGQVHLLRSELIPHPMARDSRAEMLQEKNLAYVAVTRVKDTYPHGRLCVVEGDLPPAFVNPEMFD